MRASFRAALVLALGAHASIALAFARVPLRSMEAASTIGAASEEREVSLVDSPSQEEPEASSKTAATGATTTTTTRASEPGKYGISRRTAALAARASRSIAETDASPAANVVVSSVALVREAAPVLDLPSRASGPLPDRASGTSPRGGTAIDSVRAALDDHDRALGLGTDSVLVAAIRHAALGSRVPLKSSATLWATAGADGSVIDAEARNVSSDAEAWNEVAAEVVRAMKGQHVRAVLGARGARLSFRVESLVRQGAGNAVAPSVRVGTPLYRCMESCTASGNIDPTDALLSATSHPERFVDVRALSSTRID